LFSRESFRLKKNHKPCGEKGGAVSWQGTHRQTKGVSDQHGGWGKNPGKFQSEGWVFLTKEKKSMGKGNWIFLHCPQEKKGGSSSIGWPPLPERNSNAPPLSPNRGMEEKFRVWKV